MPVDAHLAGLLEAVAAAPALSTLGPEGARAAFRAMSVDSRPVDGLPPVASVEDTTVAGADGPLPARVYRPRVADGTAAVPTVVLFHGGGFVIGDLDTHATMARAISADAGAVVVAVDYRLAPEHRFPAAALDAIAAVTDVRDHLDQYGGSGVLGVAGDSAGGNLSAVASQHVDGIAAQLLVYPATDVLGEYPSRVENATGYFLDQPTMEWFIGSYADADTDLADPRISPLRGELAGQPPAVVVTAEFDPLRDEGAAYADALEAAGVRVEHRTYPGLIHGFFDMGPWSPACQAAIDETIAAFAGLLREAGDAGT